MKRVLYVAHNRPLQTLQRQPSLTQDNLVLGCCEPRVRGVGHSIWAVVLDQPLRKRCEDLVTQAPSARGTQSALPSELAELRTLDTTKSM
jgi:hypothetical protein